MDTPYWSTALEQAPERVVAIGDLDHEAIAALDPSVILAANYGDLEKSYDTLSEIAPVVALPEGADSDWENRHEIVAKALDREQQGKDNIAAVEDAFTSAR